MQVEDCCCPGDFYEIYVAVGNSSSYCLIGTTPQVQYWGCQASPPGAALSKGNFTVSLQAGTYHIKIRDAGFDGHTQSQISSESMCPAGYYVTGTLGTFTGKPWPCAPTITSVSPNQGTQGQNLSVIITGTNLTGATSVSFGSGITVNGYVVNSSTQVTGNITISSGATPGARDVSVTTPQGATTKTGAFTVIHATCTVTASVSGGHGSVAPTTQTVSYGGSASISIIPDAGYHIYSITDNGNQATIANPYVISPVSTDHNVVVTFAINTYTVSASVSGGHGAVSPPTQTVNYGASASVSITPDVGYHIFSITDNGNQVTIASPYVISGVTADHNVVVTFAINTYTVSALVSGGHGSVSPATQTVNYGASASISITPDVGYHITSIIDNGNPAPIANPYVVSSVTADNNVVVTFAINTYAVNGSVSGGHGAVDPASQTLNYGSDASISITPDIGYHVVSITDNGNPASISNPYVISSVIADHNVVVTFAINTYTVNASASGGHGSVDPPTQTVSYGDDASISIAPDIGYHIASITDNGSLVTIANPYVISSVTSDHNVVVTFAVTTYTVSASVSGGHGSVSPATQTVNYGDDASISITPDPQHHIVSITDNGIPADINNPYVISSVTLDHNVVVTFAIITYAVNASVSGGHGSVSPATQTVDAGTDASISITPNAGYHIASITDNSNPQTVANPYVISSVTADHGVVVTFAINTYAVSASVSGGHGSVSPDMQTVNYGEDASISIAPDVGYHIAGITDNGNLVPVSNPYVMSAVNADHDVVVTFAINTYTVTALVSGGHGSVSPGTQTVTYGASASINITPDVGYHIDSITDNGNQGAIANPYVILDVNIDHDVVVTFAINTYTVSASVSGGHGSVSPVTQTANYGGSASISITPDTGYHISGITDNGNPAPIANPHVISGVVEDTNVVVTFAINTYTISASVSGGHGNATPATQTVSYGAGASITITRDAEYQISSITDNGNAAAIANPYVISSVTADHNVVVTFSLLPPTAGSVNPNHGSHWQNLSVTIAGAHFNGVTSVSFGSGITVNSFTVNSLTQITGNITIDGTATIGPRDVSVTTPAGSGTATGAFSVVLSTAPSTISSVSPNQGIQGQSLTVIITGTNLTDATTVSFGGNITVTNFTVNSPSQITAGISIAAGAGVGSRDVSVTTPGSTALRINGFTVLGAPPSAPILVYPTSSGNVSGHDIVFQWQLNTKATTYFLEVNTDPGWNTGTRFFYAGVQATSQMVTGFPGNGTTYYWRVWAGNSNGWSTPSSQSFINVAVPPPASPILTYPAQGATVAGKTIQFAWQASGNATSYWLEVNTDPGWGSGTRLFYGAAQGTSQMVGGFPNPPLVGVTYYWRVWAGSSWGWSTPSSASFVNLGPPTPAAPVLIYPANGSTVVGPSITFQWEASGNATVYWLEVNRDPNWGAATRAFYNSATTTSQTVNGLTNDGTTYYWRVWAGNGQGWGDPSSWSFTMLTPPIAPTLTYPESGATNVAFASITFTWMAPQGATTYWLEVNTDSNWGTATKKVDTAVSGTSQTVTGLAGGTTYYWRVWAGNAAGWGPANSQSFTTAVLTTPTLSGPANGANVGGSSITFSWSAPSGATSYWLEVNTDANWGTSTRFYNASVSTNSKTVTGFPSNGTTYYWRVWAGYSAGWSAPTAGWSFVNGTAGSGPPATPTLTAPVNGSNQAGSSITFSWSAPSGATTYWLEVNTDANWGTSTRFYNAGVSTNSQTVTGFPSNGTTYYWRVWAGNSNGWSGASAGWSFVNGIQGVGPPATPTLIAPANGSNVGGSSIAFQWSAPSGATTYWLEVNTDANWGTSTRFYNAGVSTNSQSVTGFPNSGTTYYWRVWAGNANGWSAASAGWSVVNGIQGVGPPATPTLTAPANGSNQAGSSITLSWRAPSGATTYWLEVNTDANWGTSTRFYNAGVSTNSQTVTGFPNNGTTYYWRVWAGNSNGWSAPTAGWSFVNGTAGGGAPATPTLTAPANGSNQAGSSITFSWSAPSGATTYWLEVNTDANWGTSTRFYNAGVSTNSKTVTGFPNTGTTYYWRVWAGNANGWSAPTAGWSVVNGAATIPATPTLTAPANGASVAGTSITFSWSAPSGATTYWLEVNTDSAWGTSGRFYYAGVSTNSKTVTGFPNNGTTYYWRVWAGNANGWSTPTSGWSVHNP